MPRKRKLPDGMVTRPGRKGYYADFRVGGRRVQKKLGTDFAAAKSILNELKGRAERSEFGLLDNNYPLKDLRDAYLKRCRQELRAGSTAGYEQVLTTILDWLGVQKVNQIDVSRVLAYREHQLQYLAPRRVNYHVRALSGMLKWGVTQKLIGSNPLQEIKPLLWQDNLKEGRPLTDDEVKRLLDKSLAHWRDLWYALLVTGMRKSELAHLRFADIDWDARELVVRTGNAKSKRERRIPIEDGLYAILKRQRAAAPAREPCRGQTPAVTDGIQALFTQEHVFVTRKNTPLTNANVMYVAFIRCCERANVEHRTLDAGGRVVEHVDIHSLRRTFTTNAILNGADPKSVQEILGHRTLEMTMKVYAKVKGLSKRQTIARLSYSQGTTHPEHVLPLKAATG
jgi:integrase